MNTKLDLTVTEHDSNQRLDNFLFKRLKDIPKSRIYRAFRSGEIRVNQKRVKQTYRMETGDVLRVPPFWAAPDEGSPLKPPPQLLKHLKTCILYEDEDLLVLNKPPGLAVHGGSGLSYGVIDVMRDYDATLQLVHRLDRDTSGCLLFAKNRPMLLELHRLMQANKIEKTYQALVWGRWPKAQCSVLKPLAKHHFGEGDWKVEIDTEEGKSAETVFTVIEYQEQCTLLQAVLKTGRTHQIRVHAASEGHAIVGDDKYGDKKMNKKAKRLCLHALSLRFLHHGKPFFVKAETEVDSWLLNSKEK